MKDIEENENIELLQEGYQKIILEELFLKLKSSINGISNDQRKLLREENGLNLIPSPNKCPNWLCCLLPCLLRTHSMRLYQQSIPEYAEVKINQKWVKIDPGGIVLGDIVRITPGCYVPADLRIIELPSDHCMFNTVLLSGISTPRPSNPHNYSSNYLNSENIALTGYHCVEGECYGVVIAIGSETILGKMIKRGDWPPTNIS